MTESITTTAQIDPAVSVFYDRVLLQAAHPKEVHLKFAQRATLAKKGGNTYKWRRYANLADADVPLPEGVTPPGEQLSKSDLTVQISWYGSYVHITDVVDLTVEDAVLAVASDKLGKQAGKTFDTLMRDILAATASATLASGGSNGETPTEITAADTDAVVQILIDADAEMMTPQINASTKIATEGVRKAFWGIAHTNLIPDLDALTGWKNPVEYSAQNGIDDAEWGAYKNTRWLVTTNADKSSDATPIYKLFIIGKDAYGTVEHSDMQAIYTPAGGQSDPLHRSQKMAWKTSWAARILNDTFIHTLKVTKDT